MDPLTALSVATATIQFVEFGSKILKLCAEIRENAKGTTEANAEIESSTQRLQEIQRLLKPVEVTEDVPEQDVQAIEDARRECEEAAIELLQLLQDLKPSRRRWFGDDAKAAYRAHRAQKKIEALQQKLERRNERLQSALTVTTRIRLLRLLEAQENITDLIQHNLIPKVQEMHTESETSHSLTHKEISLARTDTISAHHALDAKLTTTALNQEASGKQIEGRLEEARITAVQKDFLDSLAFPDMTSRHQSISPPATGTFEWIFSDETLSDDENNSVKSELRGKFRRWLIGNKKVFWISGKPGSGKSSLVSFIENHSLLHESLKQWSGTRTLTVLNFFFWRAGSDLQKSIPGLLRSLLHQILKRNPSMIDRLCSDDSFLKHSEWTQTRLLKVLRKALSLYEHGNDCVFFLIDGLDELEGNHLELLDVVLDIQLMSNAKLCVSSRPEPAFQYRLQSYPSLRLEDLNYADIRDFVCGKLAVIDYDHTEFIHRITDQAQGMFLWAALVCKDIVDGFLAFDDQAKLQQRLDDIPEGLEPLFARLFSNIDKHHRNFLLFIFQILKEQKENTIHVGFVTACLHHNKVVSLEEFCDLCHKAQQQIKTRSKGLIEATVNYKQKICRGWALQDPVTKASLQTALDPSVIESWQDFANAEVTWLHRSAYDYIFNSAEADLPSWIRELDIAREALHGAEWLFRYGLLTWTFCRDGQVNNTKDLETDNIAIIVQHVENVFLSGSSGTRARAYETLDIFGHLIQSSLTEGSWLELDMLDHLGGSNAFSFSRISVIHLTFWVSMLDVEFQDYTNSRLALLKSGRYAYPTCCIIVQTETSVVGTSLARLLLDFFLSAAENNHRSAPPITQNARNYRFIQDWRGGLSWLTRGEIFEIDTVRTLHYLLDRHNISNMFQDTGHGYSSISADNAIRRVTALVDLWQLFQLVEHDGADPKFLQIFTTANRPSGSTEMIAGFGDVLKLRLIVADNARAVNSEEFHVGINPLCVFHPSEETTASLARFMIQQSSIHRIEGSRAAFSRCRDALIEDVWADVGKELDATQQLVLLTCIKTEFEKFWKIIEVDTDEVGDTNASKP